MEHTPLTSAEETGTAPVSVQDCSRLTLVGQVYHQQAGCDPSQASTRFSCFLETDEQAYERILRANSKWQQLDRGWIDSASVLVITNQERYNAKPNFSQEEKRAIEDNTLEVSYQDSEDSWLVPPGQSMRACPSDLSRLRVRTRGGAVRFSIFIVPG